MHTFIRMLDLETEEAFTCPHCSHLPHDQQCLIIDGKAMGMQRSMAHPYSPPYAGSAREPVW